MSTAAIALSGSGFRFPCHVGALTAFQRTGVEIKELSGTSGGAMVAALAASGIAPDVLQEIVNDLDTSNFMSFNWSALWKLGFSHGKHIEAELKRHLQYKRFRDMEIPLSIVSTDVRTGNPMVFSTKNTPDFPVWQAVRASIAIPFVLTPVTGLGRYGKEYENLYLLDGGMVNNIPVSLLDLDAVDKVFGVHLIDKDPKATANAPFKLGSLAMQIVNLMLNAQEELQIASVDKPEDNVHIIKVNTNDLLDFGRELTDKEKDDMFNAGFTEALGMIGSLEW